MAPGDPQDEAACPEQGAPEAPGLGEAWRLLGEDGRAGIKAARDSLKALRILFAADFALARSAFGRVLAFTGVAIAFGAASAMLLMATLVVALQSMGMSWLGALLLALLLCLLATAGAGYGAMRYFEYTRMQATRRQLARLGFGELADDMPDPGSAQSAQAAAEQLARASADAPAKKGLGVDVTPP